ncbi:anthranilate synthase component 1 [Natronocella acetinitrilica]|uniref:Anthranilate synthase component 1 n=1 Tax=Natronocella acetinitrilica TaxID=414046 RepID=A0AAE3G227_9GAMM|nr:anthranilate synthase component I [Natronocella acetinitrilica]MCP1673018.1 anthranilate synthase component 1 [Natronocella acetinitrilica]
MNQEQFQELARQGHNRIPVVREVLADLDTPLSTYLKLADGPYSFLLESVQGGEKWGRYSIIGLPSRTVVRVFDHEITVTTDGQVVERERVDDPLAWIEAFHGRYEVPQPPGHPQLPRFIGGLAGYFGYDTIRYIEPRLKARRQQDDLGVPDILLMVADEVLVFDNLGGRLYLVVHVDPQVPNALESGQARLDELVQRLRRATTDYQPEHQRRHVAEADFTSNMTQTGFEAAVDRIKRYIVDGDAMQVVPSQRMSVPYQAAPLDLYRALRCTNPSPYMYFLNLEDFQVAGSSPEILVRLEDDEVTVRPIAGTRRRGRTEAEDEALERELLADPKEIAEHLMLIDLGRNDVGRVSEIGTVRVTDRMSIERYSHVMHIVSNVTGRLRPGLTPLDVLRATFPAGTLSGAPKIRAMEIIDELEPTRRGVYSGAVGYWSWSGNMDTAIAIRTAVIKDGMLHVQAGAGVVHDSVPRLEWEETLSKGRAIMRAVAMAEQGLDRLDQA